MRRLAATTAPCRFPSLRPLSAIPNRNNNARDSQANKRRKPSSPSSNRRSLSTEIPAPSSDDRRVSSGLSAGPSWSKSELRCPHFQQHCPGCEKDRDLAYPEQHARAAAFFKSKGIADVPLYAGPAQGWRLRAKLAVRDRKRTPSPSSPSDAASNAPALGLYLRGTHELLRIPECAVHSPRINAAAAAVEQAIGRTRGMTIYDERTGKGLLRYVQLTATSLEAGSASEPAGSSSFPAAPTDPTIEGALALRHFSLCRPDGPTALVQVTLVLNAPDAAALPKGLVSAFLVELARAQPSTLVHSVALNFNTARTNTIFGPTWEGVHGPPLYLQALPTPFPCPPMAFSPGSFQQANLGAFAALLGDLVEYVPQGASVADLFAGVGVIGLALAASGRARSVACIEINPESSRPFAVSKALLERWHVATRPDMPPPHVSHAVASAAAGADPGALLTGHEVAIVDPPRKGLDRELVAALTARDGSLPELRTLLYVSCGLPALERDAEILLRSGMWKVVFAKCYLFFPGTETVETLAVFQRRS